MTSSTSRTTSTTTTIVTSTTSSSSTTTIETTTTTQTTVTFAAVGIYALNIPTCATWNQTGTTVAGNQNRTWGTDLRSLYFPVSIFIDNSGVLYVADSGNHRIVRWTTNYSIGGVCIIGCTGTSGTAVTQLNGPRDLKCDRYGNIYVTEQSNHRIMKYRIQLLTSTCPPPTG